MILPSLPITGATPPSDGFFNTSATHIGAFGTNNQMGPGFVGRIINSLR